MWRNEEDYHKEEDEEKYSARSSSATYWKNGSQASTSCRPGAGVAAVIIVSQCLMFCLFCSKKSLQTIHSLQLLAEIIETGTGPEPISKTRLFSFVFFSFFFATFSSSSTSRSTCFSSPSKSLVVAEDSSPPTKEKEVSNLSNKLRYQVRIKSSVQSRDLNSHMKQEVG